jgi:exopolyphosphatase/guanosine-5'-triphosphate,3'-diphosphate pyrophosphatase
MTDSTEEERAEGRSPKAETPESPSSFSLLPSSLPLVDLPIPPAAELYAGVDVGTNSVKMIIADLARGQANRIYEQSIITRIGEGMQALGNRLREDAMLRTLDALNQLAQAARAHKVRAVAAVGTAALRDAENRDDFLRRVRERCGFDIEIIPGEEEARLSYLAVRRDPQWRSVTHLRVIDIGGGSTEVIQGLPGTDQVASRISVNYGAVKLTETFLKSDPPTITQLEQANQAVQDAFERIPIHAPAPNAESVGSPDDAQAKSNDTEVYTLVGVGGTVTNLGAIDQGGRGGIAPLHGHVLSAERLGSHIDLLAASTVEQRKTLPGLDPRRADIILGGAILLAQALARLNEPSVAISTRGLRWGLLYDRFQ